MYRFSRFTIQGKQRAFTLIELLVTLVVVSVVLTIAIPSFNDQITRNRANVLGQDLIYALSFARSEAVKRAGFVSLCASDDGAKCSDNKSGWANGFIAVVDGAATEGAVLNLNKISTTLHVWEKQHPKAVISINSVNASGTDDPVSFIRFTSSGALARTTSTPAISIKMKMANDEGKTECVRDSAQEYSISLAGMVRLANESCW